MSGGANPMACIPVRRGRSGHRQAHEKEAGRVVMEAETGTHCCQPRTAGLLNKKEGLSGELSEEALWSLPHAVLGQYVSTVGSCAVRGRLSQQL